MNKQKVGLLPKIIMGIGMVIIFVIGINYFIEASTGTGELSYFSQHFMVPIVLLIVGGYALFLPTVSQKSMAGDDRGDKMMVGVGLLLILCSIIALITSFI